MEIGIPERDIRLALHHKVLAARNGPPRTRRQALCNRYLYGPIEVFPQALS